MMNLEVGGFDWDDGNRTKCQRHGVAIAEIEALFVRALALRLIQSTRRARTA